jgi:hypothetical protein
MTVEDHRRADDVGPSDFLQSRGTTLTRVAGNHARWEHNMRVFGKDLFLAEKWTDGDGVEHRVVITPSFLDAHRKLRHSLVIDMEAFGTVGRTMAERILKEQRAPFHQTTPFANGITPSDSIPAAEDTC